MSDNASLIAAWLTPNCRAIIEGLTPALKAARIALIRDWVSVDVFGSWGWRFGLADTTGRVGMLVFLLSLASASRSAGNDRAVPLRTHGLCQSFQLVVGKPSQRFGQIFRQQVRSRAGSRIFDERCCSMRSGLCAGEIGSCCAGRGKLCHEREYGAATSVRKDLLKTRQPSLIEYERGAERPLAFSSPSVVFGSRLVAGEDLVELGKRCRVEVGRWTIPVDDEVFDHIATARLPGETDDDVVSRLLRAAVARKPS